MDLHLIKAFLVGKHQLMIWVNDNVINELNFIYVKLIL